MVTIGFEQGCKLNAFLFEFEFTIFGLSSSIIFFYGVKTEKSVLIQSTFFKSESFIF